MKTSLLATLFSLTIGLIAADSLSAGTLVGNPGKASLIGIYPSRNIIEQADGAVLEAGYFLLTSAGDVDLDGAVREADALQLASWLYGGGKEPPCQATCDANRDGHVDVKDVNAITADAQGLLPGNESVSVIVLMDPSFDSGESPVRSIFLPLPPIVDVVGANASPYTAMPELDASANLPAVDPASLASLYFEDAVRTAREKSVAVLAVVRLPGGEIYGFQVWPDELPQVGA